MIGLPKVNKVNDDRSAEVSPSGMMNSHTNMNPLKMPQLVDRSNILQSKDQGLPGGALPSLQRHQQQSYNNNRSEFKQAYENHVGKSITDEGNNF